MSVRSEKKNELLYLRIAGVIEQQILQKILRIGDRLPSLRTICREYGVSQNTALNAYFHLESRRLIETRPKSGYYVRYAAARIPAVPATSHPRSTAGQADPEELISRVYETSGDGHMLFSLGTPANEMLPIARLNKGLLQATRALKSSGVAYDEPDGNSRLRRQVARWTYAMECDLRKEDIITTSGCLNALSYCMMAVTRPGDTVAMESPVSFGMLQLARSLGVKVLELPTHPLTGVDPGQLEKIMKHQKVQAVLLISNFSNPVGSCMPDEHKRQAVLLAEKYNVPLIENDINGDVYFGPQRPKSCKTYDRSGIVLWCGSISKTLAPGYRVGWTAPGRFIGAVRRMKLSHTICTAAITQDVIAGFLETGRYEHHLRKLRHTLQGNMLRYTEAIAGHFPEGTKVSRPQGGSVLWVELPEGISTIDLYEKAIAQKINFAPGRLFTLQNQYDHCMRLNYGLLWTEKVASCLRTLGEMAKGSLFSGLLAFLLCFFTTGTHAQQQLLDSLQMRAERAKSDSERIMIRLDYGIQLSKSDMAKGIAELQDASRLSTEKKLPYVHAAAVQAMASLYYEAGNYINTIAINEEAEKLFVQLPDCGFKSFHLGAIYNDVGASYSLINDMENAQVFYTKSIRYLEELRDTSALVVSYFNIAFIYIDMQEWKTALTYFDKAITIERSMVVNRRLDGAIHLYSRAAAIHFRLQQLHEGLQMLQYAAARMPQASTDISQNYYYNARGEYHYAAGQYMEALAAFRTAYVYGLSWHDPYYQADDAWEIGRTFLALHQTDSAEQYLQRALDTAKKYNYLPKIRFIMNDWCDYFAQTGNFSKAYRLRTDLQHFTDSLIGVQNHNRILLFDARYNSQQKESQILQLEKDKAIRDLTIRQKNILNYALIVSAGILLALSLLSYRNYKQRQKLQQQRISELETEKQLAATEAVLKGEERERTRLAKDLHDGLGGTLSGIKYTFQSMKASLTDMPETKEIFDRSMDMIDSSIREMRRVAHNMMPEALLKFGLDTALQDFCNNISHSGVLKINYYSSGLDEATIDQTTSIAVYRIVQELVNNTIKHAQATQAIVQVNRTDGMLTLTVEDDGRGFDTALLSHSKGIGWSNVQSRVGFLKGHLDVKSAAGQGTSVLIEINV